MKIDRQLNLVIPIYGEGEDTPPVMYVHAAPLSREVFEANFLIISRTIAAVHGHGLGIQAAPRIAMLLLRNEAKAIGADEESVAALIAEMRRLASVITATPTGWTTMPLDDALAARILDDEDVSEVENAMAFFTCASSMLRKVERAAVLNGAAKMWGAQTSSLNSTAFANSLPISTGTGNSGEKAPA
jgi:hypothetical protein